MARIARVVVPEHPHHVTQRGSRRMRTFFRDADYKLYIELTSEACKATGTEIWAYCLMPNHVHLVMVPTHEDGLRATLGEAHRRYTRHVNSRHDWRGHLWQERFYSFPMDEDHLLAAVRYVERNPVAAGMCDRPEEWPWSSAAAHLRATDDRLVRVRPMLQRVSDWKGFLEPHSRDVPGSTIEKHLRTGRPLGSSEYVRSLEVRLDRTLALQRRGPRRKNLP